MKYSQKGCSYSKSSQAELIVNPISLMSIREKIHTYTSLAEFLVDIKWIVHNSIILYSGKSPPNGIFSNFFSFKSNLKIGITTFLATFSIDWLIFQFQEIMKRHKSPECYWVTPMQKLKVQRNASNVMKMQ